MLITFLQEARFLDEPDDRQEGDKPATEGGDDERWMESPALESIAASGIYGLEHPRSRRLSGANPRAAIDIEQSRPLCRCGTRVELVQRGHRRRDARQARLDDASGECARGMASSLQGVLVRGLEQRRSQLRRSWHQRCLERNPA